jgi:ubiquinone/menaquinone biosynthesis C-methylase UbiE
LPNILACPVCHAPLEGITCGGCQRVYREDGVFDLTPVPPPHPAIQARWHVWEQLQANGDRVYREDPEHNLSVGERADASAFAEFCELHDKLILDVGCGPQASPSYVTAGELVGIDPLRGNQPRSFFFVQGIAEYLPFRDRLFDRVLFATSLDHTLSPELAIMEALRVAKPGGWVCVWHGEVPAAEESPASRAVTIRALNAARMVTRGEVREVSRILKAMIMVRPAFKVPAGAVDAFHFAHPNLQTVIEWIENAGLVVETIESLDNNRFVRAVRPAE